MKDISSLIEEAEKILKSKFDIELETKSFKIYSYEEWNEFQEIRGFQNKYGVFKPVD